MKNISLSIFIMFFVLHSLFGQEPINTEYKNVSEHELEQAKFRKNRFTILLDFPSLAFFSGDWGFKTNAFKGIGTGFDYNFSEIMSLGLHVSYYNDHTKYTETKEESWFQTLDFAPVFKVNLGRNQMIVPFFEISYMLSFGKYDCNFEENYTKNYMRHIINGAFGFKIYASRWFKKTKYKNNFGIELCYAKTLFLFDNTINVPLLERDGARCSFFYRF